MSKSSLGDINITIKTMTLSDDRQDHYVCIERGGREITPRKYPSEYRNRAQYEVDKFKHVLLGHPEPNIEAPKYDESHSDNTSCEGHWIKCFTPEKGHFQKCSECEREAAND